MTEKELDKAISKIVKGYKGEYIKIGCDDRSGLPDRLIMLPWGISIYAELKGEGEKPKPLQRITIRDFKAIGMDADFYAGQAGYDVLSAKIHEICQ